MILISQLLALVVIAIGIVKSFYIYARDALTPGSSVKAVKDSRLELGHSFSLGLGFLIGASILNTAKAPTWEDIGQLAAIIAIRTALNYFLLREIGQNRYSSKKRRPNTYTRNKSRDKNKDNTQNQGNLRLPSRDNRDRYNKKR